MNEKNTLRAVALSTIYISLIVMCCHAAAAGPGCAASANSQRLACQFDLRDDFYTESAICLDSAAQDEACFSDAEDGFDEGIEVCDDILEARLDLCEALDDATHDPEFGEAFAANFVDPLEIGVSVAPNPWFPLVTGNRWVYEGDGESIEVVVTGDTKLIDGVTCVVVIDTASEEDVVVEITNDWYAQDVDGNVWYCDETADPELVDIDGSWKAGRDGNEAGLLLPIDPQPGDIFRQEFAQTDAEDVIEILAIDATEAAPGGACNGNCLLTRDFTPLEPDAEENKYYVPGIGLIVEIDLATGDRVELAEFTGVGQ